MIPNFKLYDDRLVLSFDMGKVCAFKCSFCYHYEDLGISQLQSYEEIQEMLDGLSGNLYKIITPGCEQEIFINPTKAIQFLKMVSDADKIVSFCTRTSLSDRIISELAEINKTLMSRGNYLVGEFSFISGNTRPDIETDCPSVDSRIRSMEKLISKGVSSLPFIRPVLPDELVPISDVYLLVDKTANMCKAYALGDLYFNDIISGNLGLSNLGRKFWDLVEEGIYAGFFEKEIPWRRYVNNDKKLLIKEYIRSKGAYAYESSTEAILHFRNEGKT